MITHTNKFERDWGLGPGRFLYHMTDIETRARRVSRMHRHCEPPGLAFGEPKDELRRAPKRARAHPLFLAAQRPCRNTTVTERFSCAI